MSTNINETDAHHKEHISVGMNIEKGDFHSQMLEMLTGPIFWENNVDT